MNEIKAKKGGVFYILAESLIQECVLVSENGHYAMLRSKHHEYARKWNKLYSSPNTLLLGLIEHIVYSGNRTYPANPPAFFACGSGLYFGRIKAREGKRIVVAWNTSEVRVDAAFPRVHELCQYLLNNICRI